MEDAVPLADNSSGPFSLPIGMLASFLDAVPASVAIVDRRAEVVTVNEAWRRFAACNGGDPEWWRGRNYLAVTANAGGDPDACEIAGGLRGVLAGALRSFEHDYPCHGGGNERWFRCLIAPLHNGIDGPVAGAAITHIDITAQKQAERRAVAANHAKTDFLASMSHELRTPLNAVIGFSEMLMMELWGPLDHRYKSYAGDIHQAGKHLLSLINEVLDLSKVEAGRFDLHEEPVNLPQILRGSLRLMEDHAQRAGVALNDSIGDPPTLFADARLLRQITLNLLSNAIKFTPPGGCVSLQAGTDDHGWIFLAVEDSGIGIAKHDIPRVLEPFGQIDSHQARLYQGESTGLGLPLCKRFAELHGGRLSIASSPGTGTTVTVALPPTRAIP